MKIKSFTTTLSKATIEEVYIEVSLIPGLPTIHLLGLPSTALKESVLRIKSAIKCRGYKLPAGKQIVVNINPTNFKKESLGLELAITAAILFKIKNYHFNAELYFHGEVCLDGTIQQTNDFSTYFEWIYSKNKLVITGQSQQLTTTDSSAFTIKTIDDLFSVNFSKIILNPINNISLIRPNDFDHLRVSQNESEILKILAWGGHSCLIAGPAGSGKTTLSKISWTLLEFHFKNFHKNNQWPIYSKPHHSTPLASLLGGGINLFKGEATQNNLGVFVLDELLEFSRETLEAFRQPLEEKKIEVIRQGKKVCHDFNAQIIATTNLCPCGDWTPNQSKEILCNYSYRRCRSYCEKISGPLLDRFDLVFYSNEEQKQVLVKDIYEELFQIKQFHDALPNALTRNSNLKLNDFQKLNNWQTLEEIIPKTKMSLRRLTATLKIAKTISELRKSSNIEAKDIEQAVNYTVVAIEKLKTMQPNS